MALAEDWIRGIVHDVLDDIDSTSSLAPRLQPGEVASVPHFLEPILLDLTAENPMMAVLSHTLVEDGRHGRRTCRLMEVTVLKQEGGSSCGYHSLHNALLVLNALRAPTPQAAKLFLKELLHRGSFWFDFSRMRRRLRERSAIEDCPPHRYPWGSRILDSEIMERSHLSYLLNNGVLPEVQAFEGEQGITRISEICWEDADRLEAVFQSLEAQQHAVHAFIVGSMQHWFTVVVHKSGAALEVFVLDSKNRAVTQFLGATDEALREHLHSQPWFPTLSAESAEMAFLNRKHARDDVAILVNCLLGTCTLKEHLVTTAVDALLQSFHSHCTAPQVEGKDAATQQLLAWLDNYYPPPMLLSVVRRLRQSQCLNETGCHRLQGWAHGVRERCPDLAAEPVAALLARFNKRPNFLQQIVQEAEGTALSANLHGG